MKSNKMLVMICAFAAVIGVFALVNAKEKPIEYSREELAELFEKYPVSLLCKEFDEKKVILSNPSSKEELNALIGSLTLEDPKLFEYDGKKSTIYSGTTENCESFAFLENDEEKVLVVINPSAQNVSFDFDEEGKETIYAFGGKVECDGSKVTAEGQSVAFIRLQERSSK